MPAFQPIRTARISQKIVDQIREMLHTGQLKPGDRLPSEREIAEQLQVSRPAVREALTALETMGLIEIRPGEGTFVRTGDLIIPFSLLLASAGDEPQTREMMEIRLSLEGQGAYLAAQRALEEDLVRIEQCLVRMEQSVQEARPVGGGPGEAADWEFHMAVALASRNSLLVRVMLHLQDALKASVQEARDRLFQIEGMPQQLLEEHRQVYLAIRNGDATAARDAMSRHITGAMQHLLS